MWCHAAVQEVPDFSLSSVQVVVYDEADRLFEMGFAEQLNAIMKVRPRPAPWPPHDSRDHRPVEPRSIGS